MKNILTGYCKNSCPPAGPRRPAGTGADIAFNAPAAVRALAILITLFLAFPGFAQQEINIQNQINVLGMTRPIPVALEGFSGETESVLRFDLYVQGFSFVTPDAAQYIINGSNSGNVIGSLTDKFAQRTLVSRSYVGSSLRREAHAFADDIVKAVTGQNGIAQTKIAFKAQRPDGTGEIYVSDFDGYNAQAITSDDAIVAAPAWVPDRLALYYTSYKLGNPDIFYHNLSTGDRRLLAAFSGLNTKAAVSPDGSRVAMILSRSGWPEVWTCSADGSNFRRMTSDIEDSSPCWSPDGKWILFATKLHGVRTLAKVPAEGGAVQRVPTPGVLNPTEPDWSPDGKWIAFTSLMGEFDICVMPASGGVPPTVLVRGQDPSWSPNSRTLIYNHGVDYRQVLSVLDVFTKQYKDIGRISGSDSEPAWQR
jgi:TolB protein